MNPFNSVFLDVFSRERHRARSDAFHGGVIETEQLVWALWKILKTEGTDVCDFSIL